MTLDAVWGEYRIARGDKPRHGISSTIGCSVPLLGEGPGAAELVTFTWSGLDADAHVDLGRLYTLPLPSDAVAMEREDETARGRENACCRRFHVRGTPGLQYMVLVHMQAT